MKKLLSISDNVARQLEQHAKEQKSTQSKVVEVAISLYLALHTGAKAMEQQLRGIELPSNKEIKGVKK